MLRGEGAGTIRGTAADGDQHAVLRAGELAGETPGDGTGAENGPAQSAAHGDLTVGVTGRRDRSRDEMTVYLSGTSMQSAAPAPTGRLRSCGDAPWDEVDRWLPGSGSVACAGPDAGRVLLDRHQELGVRLRLLEPLQQQLERLLLLERSEHAAQLPHDRQLLAAHQLLLAAGAGGVDVHRREDPLVGEVARQAQLHVAGSLELLEAHLVPLRAGLHQRGGQAGQRISLLV